MDRLAQGGPSREGRPGRLTEAFPVTSTYRSGGRRSCTSRGIHPAILSKAGLGPAVRVLSRRSTVPVELDLRTQCRLPEQIEMAAYFVVSEALTNTAKHALASVVNIELDAQEVMLRLVISDNGIGGADPGHGSGLVGPVDRIEALGGRLDITSLARKGTSLSIEIPVENQNVTNLA
jgi:signal transduction histidine kinase